MKNFSHHCFHSPTQKSKSCLSFRDPAWASGPRQTILWTVLCLPIPRLLRLGFAGKRDDIGRAHGSVAWTAREMVDFAAFIPPHVATTGSGRRRHSRSNVCLMTGDLREDIR